MRRAQTAPLAALCVLPSRRGSCSRIASRTPPTRTGRTSSSASVKPQQCSTSALYASSDRRAAPRDSSVVQRRAKAVLQTAPWAAGYCGTWSRLSRPLPYGMRLQFLATHRAPSFLCASSWPHLARRSCLCNLVSWRRLLLPSSNGYFTAQAVGRVFGSLANRGLVRVDPAHEGDGGGGGGADGVWARLASEEVVADVTRRIADPTNDVASTHPDHGELAADASTPARESSGWCPWASLELHGATAARRVINSEGMGGTAAWADPKERLAVCVLKSVYEPLSALGGSISPDVIVCAAELRSCLGIASESDRGAKARYAV